MPTLPYVGPFTTEALNCERTLLEHPLPGLPFRTTAPPKSGEPVMFTLDPWEL